MAFRQEAKRGEGTVVLSANKPLKQIDLHHVINSAMRVVVRLAAV
jgi:hypothetical protein